MDKNVAIEKTPPTITLFLMTEKGHRVLSFAAEKYPDMISEVVVGRDSTLAKDCADEIIQVCKEVGIKYSERKDFDKIVSEYAIAISWRWLIHHSAENLIVLHDSILPKYRGFAPLINSLLNGEKKIGVSAIFGDKAYDAGPIISQATSEISYPITIQEAIEINNQNYLSVIEGILNKLKEGVSLDATAQSKKDASYSIWRDENDFKIDWNLSSARIRRMIDTLGYPYKGACSTVDSETVIIVRAEEVTDVDIEIRDVGKVILIDDGMPIIICGVGLLKIIEAYSVDEDGNREKFLPPKKFKIRFR